MNKVVVLIGILGFTLVMSLPVAAQGNVTEVIYPLTFQMRNGEPSVSSEDFSRDGSVTGVRTRADIRRVVMQNSYALRQAYISRRREISDLNGTVTVKFSIDQSGKVVATELVSSTLNDSSLENTVLARVKGFDFGNSSPTVQTLTVQRAPGEKALAQGSPEATLTFTFQQPRSLRPIDVSFGEITVVGAARRQNLLGEWEDGNGAISRSLGNDIRKYNLTQISSLYDRRLYENPNITGTASIKLLVRGNGPNMWKIVSAELLSSTLNDTTLEINTLRILTGNPLPRSATVRIVPKKERCKGQCVIGYDTDGACIYCGNPVSPSNSEVSCAYCGFKTRDINVLLNRRCGHSPDGMCRLFR